MLIIKWLQRRIFGGVEVVRPEEDERAYKWAALAKKGKPFVGRHRRLAEQGSPATGRALRWALCNGPPRARRLPSGPFGVIVILFHNTFFYVQLLGRSSKDMNAFSYPSKRGINFAKIRGFKVTDYIWQ